MSYPRTFRRSRRVVDELSFDIEDDGVTVEIKIGGEGSHTFTLNTRDAAAMADEILSCVGFRRAAVVARRILKWADEMAEAERKGEI